MIINPLYKADLIDIIQDAPDECFNAPADSARARLLNNEIILNGAAISFQEDFEEYGCDYNWSMSEALKSLGLKHLEMINPSDEALIPVKPGHQYVAVIAPEYARNVEIYDHSYEDENGMDDYFYDDSRWYETTSAEIFIGIFQTSKHLTEMALQEIKTQAINTAISNGLCEKLSIDAIKLVEI
jgi:hypothetical protein